jgi:hypothetical protein
VNVALVVVILDAREELSVVTRLLTVSILAAKDDDCVVCVE